MLLTEQEILILFDEAYAPVGKTAVDFARDIESAVLAKIKAQGPVAWTFETHYYPESRTIENGVVFERGIDTVRTTWTPIYRLPEGD